MLSSVGKFVSYSWNFFFDHRVSPLRHIQDMAVRHMILQVLGWMWAIAFSLAVGSYTILAASLIGHAVLISAAAITVATYATASKAPKVFMTASARGRGGEHE